MWGLYKRPPGSAEPLLDDTWRRAATWRQSVQRRLTMLYDDLARLEGRPLADSQRTELDVLMNTYLHDADVASRARVGPGKWWCGTEVERAWARLREVEERTVGLLPESDLLDRAVDAAAAGAFYLKADDARLLALNGARSAAATDSRELPHVRGAMRSVLIAAHAEADRANQAARYLRNRLLLVSGLGALIGTLLVLAQWWLPGDPFLTAPTIWHRQAWVFLLVVMLFGAVGALFTAVPAMSKVPADFSPFNLPLQQALLKLVIGPLTAVVGLAILSNGDLGGGPPTTWPALLLVSVVFGAGQQAVTTYVDQRAKAVLTSTQDGGATAKN